MVLKIYAFEENWKASINVHTKPLKDGFCPGPCLPFEQKTMKKKDRNSVTFTLIFNRNKQQTKKKYTQYQSKPRLAVKTYNPR